MLGFGLKLEGTWFLVLLLGSVVLPVPYFSLQVSPLLNRLLSSKSPGLHLTCSSFKAQPWAPHLVVELCLSIVGPVPVSASICLLGLMFGLESYTWFEAYSGAVLLWVSGSFWEGHLEVELKAPSILSKWSTLHYICFVLLRYETLFLHLLYTCMCVCIIHTLWCTCMWTSENNL